LGGGIERIVYVDYGEKHTQVARDEAISLMKSSITPILGNSHSHSAVGLAERYGPYDAVMIDAGHSFADVVADAMSYGAMARKYVIFHDVVMPEVCAAFDWYCHMQGYKLPQIAKFISPGSSFGYGVIKL
jgi:hypothetical protein